MWSQRSVSTTIIKTLGGRGDVEGVDWHAAKPAASSKARSALIARRTDFLRGGRAAPLVFRIRSPVYILASHSRRWQGASATEYLGYFEKKQRSQRREGPAEYAQDV